MDMTKEYYVPNLAILKSTVEKHKDIGGVVWVHIGGIINPDFPAVVDYCKSKKYFSWKMMHTLTEANRRNKGR